MLTTITKWGNSQGVRLSRKILNQLNLKTDDRVEICVEGEKITIKKNSGVLDESITLDDLFKGYTGNYECSEYDWGEPQGREVW